MKPTVAIVGRPNVGKSTLFNRLIGERRAIVLNTPGVTRDRHYGEATWNGRTYSIVDTGGFEPEATEGIVLYMREQALQAIEQADVVIFLTDGRDGLMPADREVAGLLRRAQHKTVFAVNKCDNREQNATAAEFYSLGVTRVYPMSAEHGRGVNTMLDAVNRLLPEPHENEGDDEDRVTRVALVGRPNVGKSTLTNRLLGQERMIVDSKAGTTRDAIDSRLMVGEKEYVLIDTAGLRKKKKIRRRSSEGYSVLRTLNAIERCHVAILMVDAEDGVTDQDAKIAGYALEKGRALIVAVNKWDAIEKDNATAKEFLAQIRLRLPHVAFAPVLYMSGLTGQRVHKLMGMVDKARESHLFRASTGPLNRWLKEATIAHSPPVSGTKNIRLYYATQARTAPPTIIVHCNDANGIHFSYKRFLVNQFREAFDVPGTPIRLTFKGKANPYTDEEGAEVETNSETL